MAEAKEMDSILLSVKKMIGVPREYTVFDTDIITHINTTFDVLNQMGVGPEEGFSISDESTEWNEYLTYGQESNIVRSYMYLKVRTLFDPPTNASLFGVYEKQLQEYEWRLLIFADELRLKAERENS